MSCYVNPIPIGTFLVTFFTNLVKVELLMIKDSRFARFLVENRVIKLDGEGLGAEISFTKSILLILRGINLSSLSSRIAEILSHYWLVP
jgi:hypothetical protein